MLANSSQMPADDEDPATVLDHDALDALALLGFETGNQDFLDDMIVSFFASTDTGLRALRAAVAAGRAEAAAAAIHAMKGPAGQLGARRLFAVCEELETALRNGTAAPAAETLAQMEDAVAAALGALRRFSATRLL